MRKIDSIFTIAILLRNMLDSQDLATASDIRSFLIKTVDFDNIKDKKLLYLTIRSIILNYYFLSNVENPNECFKRNFYTIYELLESKNVV